MNSQSPSKKKNHSTRKSKRSLSESQAPVHASLEQAQTIPIEKQSLTFSPSILLPLLLTGCFLYLWWMHAWLGDDINFTVRSVLNFLDGKGISWNPGERVESFTHPAWFFLMVLAQFLTHNIYVSVFALSFLCSFLAFMALIRSAKNPFSLALVGGLLLSRAFMDYTSSGLENALSFLLVYMVIDRFFAKKIDTVFYLLVSITLLNRMDYALILLPICIVGWKSIGLKWRPVAVGAAPLILWILFSTFYFGFPLPNTLLGKMNTGYPQSEYYDRFLNFVAYSVHHDLITILLIAVGVILPLVLRTKEALISLGLILYFIYLRQIGGDFMAGRFFSVPLFIAVYMLIRVFSESKILFIQTFAKALPVATLALIGLVLIAVVTPSTFKNDTHYKNQDFENDVADERGYYYEMSSLALDRFGMSTIHDSDEVFITACGMAGVIALTSMDSYIYDSCGLGSPYTSRIPAVKYKAWRIGHHERHLVPGFNCWIKDPSFQFDDPEVTRMFNDIRLVTTGPLFDRDRIAAIYRLNLTPYNIDKKAFENVDPPAWQAGAKCPGNFSFQNLFNKPKS